MNRTLWCTAGAAILALAAGQALAAPSDAQAANKTDKPAAKVDANANRTATAKQDVEQWRYRWYNSQWWYWLPSNRWVYFENGAWQDYASPDAERHVMGYRGVPNQQTDNSVGSYGPVEDHRHRSWPDLIPPTNLPRGNNASGWYEPTYNQGHRGWPDLVRPDDMPGAHQ